MFDKCERIRLLYIEDNDMLAENVKELLDRSENTIFDIHHETTLEGGLNFLDKECKDPDNCSIDIILLDLVLPNSKGIGTFTKVKQKCEFLPIVIVSGHEDIACKCVKLGAQDYLIKTEISGGILVRSLKYAIRRVSLENKFENIVQSSSLGYHMYKLKDEKLIFVGYNQAASNILGVDNEQFMNKEISDAFPSMHERVIKGYKLAIEGTPWINKIVDYGSDIIKHATFGVNAYRSSRNHLVVTFSDITERLEDQEKLKLSEKKFRNLVEVTKAGIYEIDFINNKFTYVNDVICQQLGYTKEELLGMEPVNILTEESFKRFLDRMAGLKDGTYIDQLVEYQAIRKDGTITWILVAAEYIEDEDKNITGANVVAIDITDRKISAAIIEEKEQAVYQELENKIQEWREEIVVNDLKKDAQLDLIQNEIHSMKSSHEVIL